MSDIHLRKRGALAGESEDLESTGDLELELDDEGTTSRTAATMRTGRRSLLAKWVLVTVTAACVGLWVRVSWIYVELCKVLNCVGVWEPAEPGVPWASSVMAGDTGEGFERPGELYGG